MSSSSHHGLEDDFSEVVLLVTALGHAAMVSQGLFFMLLLALDLLLIAAIRWKGETWMLMRFYWLFMLLFASFAAALVSLVYAAAIGQFS